MPVEPVVPDPIGIDIHHTHIPVKVKPTLLILNPCLDQAVLGIQHVVEGSQQVNGTLTPLLQRGSSLFHGAVIFQRRDAHRLPGRFKVLFQHVQLSETEADFRFHAVFVGDVIAPCALVINLRRAIRIPFRDLIERRREL